MKQHTARTMIPGVLSGLGGFGGLFEMDLSGMEHPVLVSGTDGVGTKLKLAFLMDKHDTVGIDCVAMCVNDVVCAGAEPLFFLDYIACGKNRAGEDCRYRLRRGGRAAVQAGCGARSAARRRKCPAFIRKMNTTWPALQWARSTKHRISGPRAVCEPGDVLVALPSSGVHSNGFSLVRKVFDVDKQEMNFY